jgi:PAS domain S-box-containing protein
MKLTDISAEQIKLIEDLLKETKEMWQQIKDLEAFKENCEGILDAQNVVISQYRMAFMYLPYGIYMKNSDMKYLYCNKGYAQMLNMKVSDILGRNDQEILPQESSKKSLASENRAWYLGQVVEAEENRFIDGEKRMFHVVRRLIKGEKDDLACLLGVLIDVTERKRQEEECRALQATLEERKKAARILLAKVADLQNLVASTQKYYGLSRNAS